MYYIYVLQSLDKSHLYVGYTNNLKQRILKHNRQKNFSTKPYAPWKLIFYEGYLEKKDAERREKYLKTNNGNRVLKRMLKEYFFKQ